MVTSFSDSVAVALSTPSRRRARGLDLLLWAPAERQGEVGDLVIDIACRLGGRPVLADLAARHPGDLSDRLDLDSHSRLETMVRPDPTDPATTDAILVVDGAQVARGRSWRRLRELVEARGNGTVVVVLDAERGLPLDVSGYFLHLELGDDEPLCDPRLLTPRARLTLDLRQVDRVMATWPAEHERTLAALDDFRDERWNEAYDEGHTFSRISRHAVPRPWTYRLAARAASAAAVWGLPPDRLLRGCVGPRIGGLLTEALSHPHVDAEPSSEGSVG